MRSSLAGSMKRGSAFWVQEWLIPSSKACRSALQSELWDRRGRERFPSGERASLATQLSTLTLPSSSQHSFSSKSQEKAQARPFRLPPLLPQVPPPSLASLLARSSPNSLPSCCSTTTIGRQEALDERHYDGEAGEGQTENPSERKIKSTLSCSSRSRRPRLLPLSSSSPTLESALGEVQFQFPS